MIRWTAVGALARGGQAFHPPTHIVDSVLVKFGEAKLVFPKLAFQRGVHLRRKEGVGG